MLLGIDIGNTSIYFGIIENDEIRKTFRIATNKQISSDEYEIIISNILNQNIDIKKIDGVIMASVVPEITNAIEKCIYNILKLKTILVKRDIPKTFYMDEDCVRALGADLIADSIGAIKKYKMPIIIFDMGTATTCSVINNEGKFMGGMICPGLKISVDALISRASQLSNFALGNPKQIIGLDTPECINAGAIYGHSAMINGLKNKIEEFTKEKYTTILTGGNSEYVELYVDKNIIIDKNLIFYGLNELYKSYKNI